MKIIIMILMFIPMVYIGFVLGLIMQWENNNVFYKNRSLFNILPILPIVDIYLSLFVKNKLKNMRYTSISPRQRLLKLMYAYCDIAQERQKRNVTLKDIIEYLCEPTEEIVAENEQIRVTIYRH